MIVLLLLFWMANASFGLNWKDQVNVLQIGEIMAQFTQPHHFSRNYSSSKSAVAILISGQVRGFVEPLVQKYMALTFVSELLPFNVFYFDNRITINNSRINQNNLDGSRKLMSVSTLLSS